MTPDRSSSMRPDTAEWVAEMRRRYTLTDAGDRLLDEAGRVMDLIALADEVIDRDGFVVPIRGGGSRVNSASRARQDYTALLLRILTTIGLDAEVDAPRAAGPRFS